MTNINQKKLKVAILGSGNIGTDLLIKVLRSPYLECTLFIGRNISSVGMIKASGLGVKISALSIQAILNDPDCCDLVFDATSARDHIKHWNLLENLGKVVIDMTPARIGKMCVPSVNLENIVDYKNVNMVSCGGQAAIPMAYLIGQVHQEKVDYIEVVSSIAAKSAGPATRANIDEYIETTEEAIKIFSGAAKTKAILNLNPAQPCIDMQTTIFAKVKEPNINQLIILVEEMVTKIQSYVPGYTLVVSPTIENDRIVIMVKVKGLGDYLPSYAGNLDIINCAAVATAESYARKLFEVS